MSVLLRSIACIALLCATCCSAAQASDPGAGLVAAKPLFRDPVSDGAADTVVVYNPMRGRWWMFYTNRRATTTGLKGVEWVHGTRIGIAESADEGASWQYVGVADIELPPELGGANATHWAPDIVRGDDGAWHMFLTVVPGVFEDWNHPRRIVHLSSRDLRAWRGAAAIPLASDRVIDAAVTRMPGIGWRMWYNNEPDKKAISYADSADLVHWTDRGRAVADQAGEGPKVFQWRGAWWMITDVWRGLAVYRSADGSHWQRQPGNLLQEPGHGADDQVIGGHADVVVSEDRAYLFYFTHPGRRGADSAKDGVEQRRSSIQVVELTQAGEWLRADRDAPTHIRLRAPAAAPVTLSIDAAQVKGPMTPIWAWFGYDEPNYTTAPNGKKLLSDIAALSPVPVYVRAHNLMTSGDGSYALKWGSTGMYSEDKDGKPVYNWTIVDQIFDTYIERKMKPLAQIGFMPEALSQHPQPYQHRWKPGTPYKEIMTGWATPPKDYDKWAELVYQWVKHSVARYGQKEVESWYWEVWNEPDGLYLATPDTRLEYFKMYDYAADAVKRALPTARMGGPHTAGAGRFMDDFLQHCLHGTNLATGKTGAPLDFVAFHAKGAPRLVDGLVQMGMHTHFRHLDEGFALVEKYPELKGIPVIIGESDPEGCAACGMQTNPENAYRNGTLYASYTAASIAREYELAASRGVNLVGAVNWSFEFEDQPWYAGFRDLATNGVNKPVLNVFRMLGMMRGERLAVAGDQAYDAARIMAGGVRGARTDINALAARDQHSIAVLVWNYHDDDVIDAGAPVELRIAGIPASQVRLRHYRVDNDTSNSYSAWKRMGSPANPSAAQIAQLQQASELAQLGGTSMLKVRDGNATIKMQLPRQAVSLVTLTY